MRIWIPTCAVAVVLCCNAGAAELTVEARQCFEWFSTLGYPDVRDAPSAEIWNGWSVNSDNVPIFITNKGFILSDTGEEFHALQFDLYELTFTKRTPKTPSDAPCKYEARPFFQMAKERLAEVRKPAHQKFFWFDGMASRLCLRAQTFFLAFVCWRKGNSELAQQLFDEAARMGPLRLDSDTDLTNPPPMQRELEIEFGIFATGIATFKMGSEFSSFGMAGISQKQVPRAELLRIFRKIVRLYPANPYRKYAQETASVLEKMVAEDKQHKLLTSKEIAKLPLDRRIDELIFQLRDQLGIEPPYSYISNEYTDGTTPAHQLVRIGYPAVPHLIIALGDKRFSRSTGDRDNYVHVCTVGDCATSILQRITGLKSYELAPVTVSDDDAAKSFRRSMEEWWAAFQAKGENEIVDWITSGRVDPVPLVPKLARMPPDLVKHAILIGALKAKGDIAAHGFLEELDKFKTDPVASLIRERLSWWPRLPDLNFDGAFDDLMREAKLETPP